MPRHLRRDGKQLQRGIDRRKLPCSSIREALKTSVYSSLANLQSDKQTYAKIPALAYQQPAEESLKAVLGLLLATRTPCCEGS